jgi:hypothetical protein
MKKSLLTIILFLLSFAERCFVIKNVCVNDINSIYNSPSRHMELGVNHLWAYHCSAGKCIDDTMNFKISIGCALRKANFKSLCSICAFDWIELIY